MFSDMAVVPVPSLHTHFTQTHTDPLRGLADPRLPLYNHCVLWGRVAAIGCSLEKLGICLRSHFCNSSHVSREPWLALVMPSPPSSFYLSHSVDPDSSSLTTCLTHSSSLSPLSVFVFVFARGPEWNWTNGCTKLCPILFSRVSVTVECRIRLLN